MKVLVHARHVKVTDAMRQHVESKLAKLPRYLGNLQSVEVILGMDADMPIVEAVATARKKTTFVATQRHEDMYTCIDQCLHKLEEQIRRHKDRVRDHQGLPRGESTEQSDQ